MTGGSTIRLVRAAGLAALLVALAWASVARAQATAQAAPPASGGWRIFANSSNVGQTIDQFNGSFTVKGLSVTDLHGVSRRQLNRGCRAGVDASVLGSVPINHTVVPSVPADFYQVGSLAHAFANVRLLLRAPGTKPHRTEVEHVAGQLRIFFPGGTDTIETRTEYSNLTYESRIGGTCNLTFSVSSS